MQNKHDCNILLKRDHRDLTLSVVKFFPKKRVNKLSCGSRLYANSKPNVYPHLLPFSLILTTLSSKDRQLHLCHIL